MSDNLPYGDVIRGFVLSASGIQFTSDDGSITCIVPTYRSGYRHLKPLRGIGSSAAFFEFGWPSGVQGKSRLRCPACQVCWPPFAVSCAGHTMCFPKASPLRVSAV
jgi:hypothetical protein